MSGEHVDHDQARQQVRMTRRDHHAERAAQVVTDHRRLDAFRRDVAGDVVGHRPKQLAFLVGAGRLAGEARYLHQVVAVAGQGRHGAGPGPRRGIHAGDQHDVRTGPFGAHGDAVRDEGRGAPDAGQQCRRGGHRTGGQSGRQQGAP